MDELLALFKSILLGSGPFEQIKPGVLELLAYPSFEEDKCGADLLEAVDFAKAVALVGGSAEVTQKMLDWSTKGVTIGEILVDYEWRDGLSEEVLGMPIRSNCGADCFVLILRAGWLLSGMPDLDEKTKQGVRAAAISQCHTFYFG